MTITVFPLYNASIYCPTRSNRFQYLGLKLDLLQSRIVTDNRWVQIKHIGKRSTMLSATKGSAKSTESDGKIPSWARPDSDEPPPWVRDDEAAKVTTSESLQLPFYAYLLASAVTAIAAIGSIFEYANQRPAFGIIKSDSAFYTPLLGFFVLTGIPTSAFLWFKSVETANKEAEEQDRRDGFL